MVLNYILVGFQAVIQGHPQQNKVAINSVPSHSILGKYHTHASKKSSFGSKCILNVSDYLDCNSAKKKMHSFLGIVLFDTN